MGLNVMLGIPLVPGAIFSALVAIALFVNKEMGKAMDMFTKVLGMIMIAMVLFMVFKTQPPIPLALKETVLPSDIDWLTILTLVGGTVGGYITFAGGHRLVDAGISGVENLPRVNKAAVSGILITGVMRCIVFLAALGVVAAGFKLDPANPPASVFQHAAGQLGYKFFGIVLWAAAITSVVGAAYTSVSFLRSMSKVADKYNSYTIMAFIAISTLVFVLVGRPVKVLVLVGALNGLILPITLGVMLLAARNRKIVGDYQHPMWLQLLGILAAAAAAWAGWLSLQGIANLWK